MRVDSQTIGLQTPAELYAKHDITLEGLIAPITVPQFLSHSWQKKQLHCPQWQGRSFDPLFSLRDVDVWLTCTRSDFPDSVIISPPEGAERSMAKSRPQDLTLESVYDSFSNGFSVVLNRLEYSWPPVAAASKSLGRFFCADVGMNAYLTPKGSKTYPVHVDDHDVFVLQISGEKVWRLYELTHLSIMRMEYRKDIAFTSSWGPERLQTDLVEELTLRPGDVLYIPRGMPHCAVAQNSTSLHLTASITPLYWTDFMKAALEQASLHAEELRLALPPDFIDDQTVTEAMRHAFERALAAFQKHISFEDTLEVIKRNRVRAQGYPLDGHFAQLNDLENLSLDSILEKRPDILCSVESSASSSTIRFSATNLRGSAHALRAFEFIRDRNGFQVFELPGLSDQAKLGLAKKLICEGLLRFVEAGE